MPLTSCARVMSCHGAAFCDTFLRCGFESSEPAERKSCGCGAFTQGHGEQPTGGAVLLVCAVLAVLLAVASPRQRHALVGGSPAVEFLRGARLLACGPGDKRR